MKRLYELAYASGTGHFEPVLAGCANEVPALVKRRCKTHRTERFEPGHNPRYVRVIATGEVVKLYATDPINKEDWKIVD